MLKLQPITQKAAKVYINEIHRHHKAPVGSIFQIACIDTENPADILGVIMVGRPVCRHHNGKGMCEVNRLATTGAKNVCSFLYAAAARVAKNLGYSQIITYILETEHGSSLKASGWKHDYTSAGGSWNVPSRKRQEKVFPQCKKKRYAKQLER